MLKKNQAYFDSDVLELVDTLKNKAGHRIFDIKSNDIVVSILLVHGELLIRAELPNRHYLIQRLYSTTKINSSENILIHKKKDNKIILQSNTSIGNIELHVQIIPTPEDDSLFAFSSKVFIEATQNSNLNIPFRDTFVCTSNYEIPKSPTFFTEQKDGRTGICFTDFGKDKSGYLFYLQDFGALQQLAEETKISYMDTVKMDWPQFGFQLPQLKNPIPKGNKFAIQHSYIVFSSDRGQSDSHHNSAVYLKALRRVYPELTKPAIKKTDLLQYARKTLHDLHRHKGCWKQVQQYAYLNAYINNYDNPPESMVQTAILKPLYLYHKTFGDDISAKIIEDLGKNLDSFYDQEIQVIHRWLPAESHLLNFEEQHMRFYIMDSWYLHYPLLQLAFLFEQGYKNDHLLEKFAKSLLYLRKAAKHFNDEWPIFFNLFTFEILKKEGNPNEYGEKDTPGLFILIMLKAYKIFKKDVYLAEAKRAAQKLKETDFEGLYQSNNTAYSAEALLELYKISPKKSYLRGAEIYLGNVIRNCAIWDMKYGNAKERESFFSLLPLKETLYAAPFEEHETAAIFHRIIYFAHENKIALSKDLLFFMTEYIQYSILRMPYYFPTLLPEDIVAGEGKSGFVNPTLWIPLEDLGDGWEAVGQVGQEVYGAAVFFNLCYHHVVQFEEDMYAISTMPFVRNNSREIILLGQENQKGRIWVNNKSIQVKINNETQQHDKYTYTVRSRDKITITLKK